MTVSCPGPYGGDGLRDFQNRSNALNSRGGWGHPGVLPLQAITPGQLYCGIGDDVYQWG